MANKSVVVENLTKKFGDFTALNNVSFSVERGEFFLLIGPSGCGKTTLLKTVIGLERPTNGKIYIEDQDVSDIPTYKRPTSLVFQNYALFPHKTVFDNVAFGLQMRKMPEDAIRKQVLATLELVGLQGLEMRFPRELSGGQQQRVALARSLVVEPKVLLLDEPLGNLDFKLQRKMEVELKLLHKRLGLTFMYVTHNQEQAMTLADKIVVMNQGVIEQIGTPDEVYSRPASIFVAKFVGEINMLRGEVAGHGMHGVSVKTDLGTFEAKIEGKHDITAKKAAYAIRPEKMVIGHEAKNYTNHAEGKLISQIYKGADMEYLVQMPNGMEFKAVKMGHQIVDMAHSADDKVLLGWNPEDAILLEKASVIPGLDIDKVILGK